MVWYINSPQQAAALMDQTIYSLALQAIKGSVTQCTEACTPLLTHAKKLKRLCNCVHAIITLASLEAWVILNAAKTSLLTLTLCKWSPTAIALLR